MLLKDTLNREMIDAGKALIQRLDANEKDISDAIWVYYAEAKDRRLMLATPIVKTKGPLSAYKMVQSVLRRYTDEFPLLDLQDITVMAPDNRVLEPFRIALKKSGTPAARLSRTTLGGRYIDDAYVYRAN